MLQAVSLSLSLSLSPSTLHLMLAAIQGSGSLQFVESGGIETLRGRGHRRYAGAASQVPDMTKKMVLLIGTCAVAPRAQVSISGRPAVAGAAATSSAPSPFRESARSTHAGLHKRSGDARESLPPPCFDASRGRSYLSSRPCLLAPLPH